jgi:plastocyanin
MKRFVLAAAMLLVAAGIVLPTTIAGGAASVRVTGKEFRFTLSPRTVTHGTVTFRFTNRGRLRHDFKIAGKKTRIIPRGRTATLRVRLRRGTYRYICTVPGHADAGMKGRLRVR